MVFKQKKNLSYVRTGKKKNIVWGKGFSVQNLRFHLSSVLFEWSGRENTEFHGSFRLIRLISSCSVRTGKELWIGVF